MILLLLFKCKAMIWWQIALRGGLSGQKVSAFIFNDSGVRRNVFEFHTI